MESLKCLYIVLELDDSLVATAFIETHRSIFLIAVQMKWFL
jgi:hypothetical protein